MTDVFKKIIAILVIAGGYAGSFAVAQSHTGAVIVPRDRTSPSIHEGPSGISSAGYKQDIKPQIGNLPASYEPFRGLGKAIGSLVLPFYHTAPTPADPSSYGFKPTIQQMFPYAYSQTGRTNRLDPGTKGIAGKNITDVGQAGQICGTGPGDLYWVGFPRPANPQQLPPPVYQYPLFPDDCACRCNEMIYCDVGYLAKWQPYGGLAPGPVSCQVCYGPANIGYNAIVKHDIYVGTDHGTHFGYAASFPNDPGYLECLRQNPGDPSGGSPGNANYGL